MPLVPHGFPDWYRLSGRADEVFLDETNVDCDAPTVRGPYFIGAHQSLSLGFAALVGHFKVQVRYFDTPGGTQLAGQTLSVRDGTDFNSGLPVHAPYADLLITPAAINSQYRVAFWSSQLPAVSSATSAVSNLLIARDPLNVPGAGNVSVTATRVLYGDATWTVQTAAVNWNARLRTIDDLGTVTTIDRMVPQNHAQRRLVFLPPVIVQVNVTNNDAGAQDFYVFVSGRPVWLGT